jgi:hypothetical protein
MKIVLKVIGGPYEGSYESDASRDPVKSLSALTDNFTPGRHVETASPAAIEKWIDTPDEYTPTQRHKYEVVSREEEGGVMRVELRYRGSRIATE